METETGLQLEDGRAEGETTSTLLGQHKTKPSSLRVKSSNVNRPETAIGGRRAATS